jgi:NADP-dependent 3-hydroxy acid dehydrogenase YdfG
MSEPPRQTIGRSGMPLAEAVALVTGASSGIGAATAIALARCGATVGLVARRRDLLNSVAAQIRASGGAAMPIEADITETEQARAAVDETIAAFGRLDTVVNNAGVMLLGAALDSPVDEWDRMIAVNLLGALHVTHAALPHLVRAAEDSPRGVADMVAISSTAGRVARPGASVYSLTKFGIAAFCESLRQELIPQRVRISLVEPGTVDTELVTHVRDDVRSAAQRSLDSITPLRPEDIADAVTYIVTRGIRVAVNQLLVRAAEQTW